MLHSFVTDSFPFNDEVGNIFQRNMSCFGHMHGTNVRGVCDTKQGL